MKIEFIGTEKVRAINISVQQRENQIYRKYKYIVRNMCIYGGPLEPIVLQI